MARRQHLTLSLFAFMVFLALTYFMSTGNSKVEYGTVARPDDSFSHADHSSGGSAGSNVPSEGNPALGISERILTGGSIAPKLENATAKYAHFFLLAFPLCLSPRLLLCGSAQTDTLPTLQGRTGSRLVETLPYDDGTLP